MAIRAPDGAKNCANNIVERLFPSFVFEKVLLVKITFKYNCKTDRPKNSINIFSAIAVILAPQVKSVNLSIIAKFSSCPKNTLSKF